MSLERFHISVVSHALGETIIDMFIRPDRSIMHRPMASHLHEEAAVQLVTICYDCEGELGGVIPLDLHLRLLHDV